MEAKITKQIDNPLLSRKEVVVEFTYDGATPKRESAAQKVADLLKASPDMITVKNVMPVFGGNKAMVFADIYKSADDKNKFQSKRNRIKGQPRQAAAKK
ncbi:MAG: hypothetical protein EPN86_05895 [Nanoarchaeota archaeon]|nr:MAG: hypothetical protein EPN86_05895 [Nanoarchaeota archaeon]